jgi:peptide/nickel transport system permease protein
MAGASSGAAARANEAAASSRLAAMLDGLQIPKSKFIECGGCVAVPAPVSAKCISLDDTNPFGGRSSAQGFAIAGGSAYRPALSRQAGPCDDSCLSAPTIPVPQSPTAATLRSRWPRQPRAVVGLAVLVCFGLAAVFAPRIAPSDPAAIDLNQRLGPPSAAHWFGTDELGRDELSRVIFGARISLFVAVSVVAISLALGLVLGGLAGFYGGVLDVFLNTFVMNAFLALPGILLAIAFVAFLGPGMGNLVLALSISGWVGYARLVRAQVLAVKEKEFVEAARSLGASDWRILTRHILPNILQPLIVQSAIGMAGVVLAEATLSFLGLGVPPPAASWGNMLSDARSHLFDSPHMVVFPALAIMLCVLAFNFLGDALRDYLDPRTRLSIGL